eukprot:gene11765-8092_t
MRHAPERNIYIYIYISIRIRNYQAYIAERVGLKCSNKVKNPAVDDSALKKSNWIQDSLETIRRNYRVTSLQVNGIAYQIFSEKREAGTEEESNPARALSLDTAEQHSIDALLDNVDAIMHHLFSCAVDRESCYTAAVLGEARVILALREQCAAQGEGCPCVAVSSPSWDATLTQKPWKVGILAPGRQAGEVLHKKAYTLEPSKLLLHISVALPDSRRAMVTIGGADLLSLSAVAIQLLSHSYSAEEISGLLQRLKEGKVCLSDFFVFIADLNESSTSSLHGGGAMSREFRSTQVWNQSSNCLKVVKTGNSADGFHHMQSSTHNEKVYRDAMAFTGLFPQLSLVVSTTSSDGLVFVQKVETCFIFSLEKKFILFSVEQCSPTFNHVIEKGSHFALLFLDSDTFQHLFRVEKSIWFKHEDTVPFLGSHEHLRVPQPLMEHQKECEGLTASSYVIGDCGVVVGELIGTSLSATVELAGALTPAPLLLSQTHQIFFPVLCLVVHNIYGPSGALCNGCIMSSHFPTTFTLLLDEENAHFTEKEVDGNVSLCFFKSSSTAFDGKTTLEECLAELPFPVCPLETRNRDHFACEAKGRLIRAEKISNHVLITVSVMRHLWMAASQLKKTQVFIDSYSDGILWKEVNRKMKEDYGNVVLVSSHVHVVPLFCAIQFVVELIASREHHIYTYMERKSSFRKQSCLAVENGNGGVNGGVVQSQGPGRAAGAAWRGDGDAESTLQLHGVQLVLQVQWQVHTMGPGMPLACVGMALSWGPLLAIRLAVGSLPRCRSVQFEADEWEKMFISSILLAFAPPEKNSALPCQRVRSNQTGRGVRDWVRRASPPWFKKTLGTFVS